MRNRVLLVDDDSLVLRSYQRSLNDTFDIDTALNPYEAIAKLKQSPLYRVIVTDLDMPGMNGVNFLRRVQTEWPDITCIVMTGKDDPDTNMQLRRMPNVVRIFFKPTQSRFVAEVIRQFTGAKEPLKT